MKLDSKYFDMIRIQPRRASERVDEARMSVVTCQWKGCNLPGHHRAPRGRGEAGAPYWFCRDHVRQYNLSYNYFEGMSEKEAEEFRSGAVYGNRPTWRMSAVRDTRANVRNARKQSAEANRFGPDLSQNFSTWRVRQARNDVKKNGRQLKPLEKRSIEQLGLTGCPGKPEIKARFKELVKQHHPDSNGGDRASEEKLREIIQAYNYLKQVGLV